MNNIEYFCYGENNNYMFIGMDNTLALDLHMNLLELQELMIQNYNAIISCGYITFSSKEDIEKAINDLQPIIDSYSIISVLESKKEDY